MRFKIKALLKRWIEYTDTYLIQFGFLRKE